VSETRRIIRERAAAYGAVFNAEGLDDPPAQGFEYLGDAFDLRSVDGPVTVKASAKTVAKLTSVAVGPGIPAWTRRQVAAVVGLCLFAAGSGLAGNRIHVRHHELRYFREAVCHLAPIRHGTLWPHLCRPGLPRGSVPG